MENNRGEPGVSTLKNSEKSDPRSVRAFDRATLLYEAAHDV
jgi:hypothetical protein